MGARLRDVLSDANFARSLAAAGLETIRARHTCRHRVEELYAILRGIGTTAVRQELAAAEQAA
jgi:spore maturation protein CgeB